MGPLRLRVPSPQNRFWTSEKPAITVPEFHPFSAFDVRSQTVVLIALDQSVSPWLYLPTSISLSVCFILYAMQMFDASIVHSIYSDLPGITSQHFAFSAPSLAGITCFKQNPLISFPPNHTQHFLPPKQAFYSPFWSRNGWPKQFSPGLLFMAITWRCHRLKYRTLYCINTLLGWQNIVGNML